MIVVGVDAGLRKLGLAVFHAGELMLCETLRVGGRARGVSAWLLAADAVSAALDGVVPDVLVIERMQLDKRTRGGVVGDVIELSGVVGAIVATVPSAELYSYTPSQWKGSRPKDVEHRYLRRLLRPAELAIVEGAGHDALDAVGIAAHYLRSTIPQSRWIR